MELFHHQPVLREDDGEVICSRCGLLNPGDDDPCIPINIEPAESGGEKKAVLPVLDQFTVPAHIRCDHNTPESHGLERFQRRREPGHFRIFARIDHDIARRVRLAVAGPAAVRLRRFRLCDRQRL